QALLMCDRELLGDHAAHRDSEQCDAIDFERIEEAGGIGGHLRDRIGGVGFVGAACAAIIEYQHAEMARELGELLVPCGEVGAEPANHHEGLRAFAVKLVVDFDIADALSWHWWNVAFWFWPRQW